MKHDYMTCDYCGAKGEGFPTGWVTLTWTYHGFLVGTASAPPRASRMDFCPEHVEAGRVVSQNPPPGVAISVGDAGRTGNA